jgi:hypothetical protein
MGEWKKTSPLIRIKGLLLTVSLMHRACQSVLYPVPANERAIGVDRWIFVNSYLAA